MGKRGGGARGGTPCCQVAEARRGERMDRQDDHSDQEHSRDFGSHVYTQKARLSQLVFCEGVLVDTSRSFDPLKDQHPVSWLIETLKPELYEPLAEWVDEVLGEEILKPHGIVMPDTWLR